MHYDYQFNITVSQIVLWFQSVCSCSTSKHQHFNYHHIVKIKYFNPIYKMANYDMYNVYQPVTSDAIIRLTTDTSMRCYKSHIGWCKKFCSFWVSAVPVANSYFFDDKSF